VLEVFSPQIHRHEISVVKTFRHLPPAIPADPAEIEQIFTNLFLNAIHEMHEGGTLGIELDLDGHYMIIRVSDTGKGIREEHLQNIFDPFFTTKGTAGSGLGLSVVLRIVKTYHGKIEVEKSDADGTTFCLRLPISAG
jgi:signal transduction histidine kinase